MLPAATLIITTGELAETTGANLPHVHDDDATAFAHVVLAGVITDHANLFHLFILVV